MGPAGTRRSGCLPWTLLIVAAAAAAAYALVSGSWPFVPAGPSASSLPFRGAGGDPLLLGALSRSGFDLGTIGATPLPALRAALDRVAGEAAPAALIYRGRLLNNVTGRGVGGFLVCAHAAPSSRGLLRAGGRVLACALTDRGGRYTFLGLPAGVSTTLSLRRPGFLQLAFTTRTSLPSDYEQDYVATVPASLARRAYADDPRHPFAAAAGGPDRGEMAFTLARERRPPDDPLRGLVSPGMYAANGVEGARIHVFADPGGAGRFDVPYTDGLVYADSLEAVLGRRLDGTGRRLARLASRAGFGRLVTRLEMPAPWRAESSRLGLAILKSMPPGIYEAEAVHGSLDCLPTRDAWPATTPRRARFEVLRNTLGDVRFTCEDRR